MLTLREQVFDRGLIMSKKQLLFKKKYCKIVFYILKDE